MLNRKITAIFLSSSPTFPNLFLPLFELLLETKEKGKVVLGIVERLLLLSDDLVDDEDCNYNHHYSYDCEQQRVVRCS